MKKFFAVLAILVFALALSSCGLLGSLYEDDLDYKSDKPDELGVYYSALNIDLISYSAENGFQHELQIGIRGTTFARESEIERVSKLIGQRICEEYNFEGENLGYYTIYDESGEGIDYIYFCYFIEPFESSLADQDSHYGFFYYKRSYALTNPSYIKDFKTRVCDIVGTVLASETYGTGFTLDKDSINFRYYLGISNRFSAKNSKSVYKTVVNYGGMMNCLMWENEDDLTSIELSYKAMAAGWYTVAILLGVAVVVILYFATKNKKSANVFRQEVFPDNRDVSVEVIDGQISMEEISANVHMHDSAEDNNGD